MEANLISFSTFSVIMDIPFLSPAHFPTASILYTLHQYSNIQCFSYLIKTLHRPPFLFYKLSHFSVFHYNSSKEEQPSCDWVTEINTFQA